MEVDVLSYVSALLGPGVKANSEGTEYDFPCPQCHTNHLGVHVDKGVYYCVVGSTLVHTDKGIQTATSLAGRTVSVLTSDGLYRLARWDSYGISHDLYDVVLENGDRIRVTGNHRWLVSYDATKDSLDALTSERRTRRVWITTKEVLDRNVPVVTPHYFHYQDEKCYREGVLHGLTFGDGTLYRSGRIKGKYAQLVAYSPEKQDLVRRFCPIYSEYAYKKPLTVGRQISASYKSLPTGRESRDYLRGFLAGLIATDGHIPTKSSPVLYQKNREVLVQIQAIARSVGLPSTRLHLKRTENPWTKEYTELWSLTFVREGFYSNENLDENLILKLTHRENAKQWASRKNTHTLRVIEVIPVDQAEEVFCCIEPVTQTWVTGEGYLTGNCPICGDGDLAMSSKEKYKQAREGRFVNGGSVQLLGLYLDAGKQITVRRAPRKVEVPFPWTEFRLLMTRVFSECCLPSGEVHHYLIKRGFSEGYWAERNIYLPVGENPLGALDSVTVWNHLRTLVKSDKERIRLGLVKEDDLRKESWLMPGKVLLPYWNRHRSLVLGVRARSTFPLAKIPYIWPPGTPASRLIYNLPILPCQTVVLTEGELKAAMASLFGIPTLSVAGIGMGHQNCARLLVRMGVQRVIISFDTEAVIGNTPEEIAHRQVVYNNVERAIKRLSYTLRSVGIRVYRFILPDIGKKSDLDGFIMMFGPDPLFDLLAQQGFCFRPLYSIKK